MTATASRSRRKSPVKVPTAVSDAPRMNLADFALDAPETSEPLRRITVDIPPEMLDCATFIFQDMTFAQVFRARKDAALMMKQNPTWTDECATTVAMLANAHQSPVKPVLPIAKGLFYAKLANATNPNHMELFSLLLLRVQQEFPHFFNFGGEVEDAKND